MKSRVKIDFITLVYCCTTSLLFLKILDESGIDYYYLSIQSDF